MQSEHTSLRIVPMLALVILLILVPTAAPAAQVKPDAKARGTLASTANRMPQAKDAKKKKSTPAKKQDSGKNAEVKQPEGEQPEGEQPEEQQAGGDQSGDAKTDGKSGKGEADCKADAPDNQPTGERVKLFYMREATKISTILDAVTKQKGSLLNCLIVRPASEDEIILYGAKEKRRIARRIIATLDLPRPGINMEMWGIQISSKDPEKMAIVMPLIRQEIDNTQQAVRGMYRRMQQLAAEITIPTNEFKPIIEGNLGYTTALERDRPLSITDILLRMVAADNPHTAAKGMATELDDWYSDYNDKTKQRHKELIEALKKSNKSKKVKKAEDATAQIVNVKIVPFRRFFSSRGMEYVDKGWGDNRDEMRRLAWQGQLALLDFGFNYARLIHDPQHFDPYYLQQSAEILNSRLQASIDALNQDMQELFVEPTLKRIQNIVANFDEVEYAQVGKTSVASLSGISTEVTSKSVGVADITPPLRLSELLTKATELANQATTFIPKKKEEGATEATELTAGGLPLSQIIGLIGAFGEERSVWRELNAGITLAITPNVLRNMTSAELKVDLKTGDPKGASSEEGVPPFSRVSQHDVKTSIYVNALDFFDLSAFISQSTLNGGRGYVPVIGTIWKGLFGDVPGVGRLFSWRKDPQTIYHQSLVLTNSFITPTAMGIALLYPTGSDPYQKCEGLARDDREKCIQQRFVEEEATIRRFKEGLRTKIDPDYKARN